MLKMFLGVILCENIIRNEKVYLRKILKQKNIIGREII